MGRVHHGSARTTAAVRRAIQHRQESLRHLAKHYGIHPKTVAKWRKRASVADLPTGPKEPKSSVLSADEEAIIVAFRRHTLLPLDDCLYALGDDPDPDAVIPAIAAFSAMASAGCRRSRATRSRRSGSSPVRSAFSLSTSPRFKPPRASSICSSPLIGPANSPSCNWSGAPTGSRPRASSSLRSRPFPTISTRS